MTIDFCGTLLVFFLLAALPILLTGWVIEGVVLWVKARRVYIPFCALDFFAPMLCVLLWRNLLDLCQESKGMDDIYEISVAGGIWALTLLVRMPVLVRCPQMKWLMAFVSLGLTCMIILCFFFFL